MKNFELEMFKNLRNRTLWEDLQVQKIKVLMVGTNNLLEIEYVMKCFLDMKHESMQQNLDSTKDLL